MEINKKIIVVIILLSFIFVAMMDCVNITNYLNYSENIDSTISNTITFISILIGFISSIYVMLQQQQNSNIMELLRKKNLLNDFNRSFRRLIYVGFFDACILIFMNFVASKLTVFKVIIYFALPITMYFLISSVNIIITICKMISAEEELKKRKRKIEKNDIVTK